MLSISGNGEEKVTAIERDKKAGPEDQDLLDRVMRGIRALQH